MSESQDPDNRRHPESTFEAEYPYNQATISRGGHEIHINDTPDKESLRIAHTKGSYVEIDKDGRTVFNSVGRAYYYLCDGFTTTVDGNYDLKVRGVQNVNVDESVSEQTGGNRYMSAGKDMSIAAGADTRLTTVGDKYEVIGGNESVKLEGGEYRSIGYDSVTYVKGVKQEVLNSDWNVTSKSNIEILSDGSMRIRCKDFIIEAETITMITRAGDITATASQNIVAKGTQIRLND